MPVMSALDMANAVSLSTEKAAVLTGLISSLAATFATGGQSQAIEQVIGDLTALLESYKEEIAHFDSVCYDVPEIVRNAREETEDVGREEDSDTAEQE